MKSVTQKVLDFDLENLTEDQKNFLHELRAQAQREYCRKVRAGLIEVLA